MDRCGEGHVFVMAGGAGSRLQPLTATRCKPALPFGAHHRVIDFVLSNLRNAGLGPIDVLLQYEPQELIRHLHRVYFADGIGRGPVRLRPSRPGHPYLGTADAVRQNLDAARTSGARWVAVFGADHIYRMDVRAMVQQHLVNGAEVSLAVLPVALESVSSFGIVEVDAQKRVRAFHEKPARATETPAHPGHALASMGNYVFATEVLCDALERTHAAGATDFGHHVLPELLRSRRVMAYDFEESPCPGRRSDATAQHRRYWRDIGTLDSYFTAHMDTLGHRPVFALDDAAWPIGSTLATTPARVDARAEVIHSSLGAQVWIKHAMLNHVVAGEQVIVARDAQIDHAVLMARTHVGEGARLRHVIVDEGNNVPAGEVIGFDLQRDRERFQVSAGGIVLVPRNHFAGTRQPTRMPLSPRAINPSRAQA